MRQEVIYVEDTYCLWCYGFSRGINRVASEVADQADIRVLSGGMLPQDFLLRDFFGRFPDPVALHQQVTTTSGQAFGAPYLEQIHNFRSSDRILNSTYPAIAIATLKALGAQGDLSLHGMVQELHYGEGLDLRLAESYRALLESLGLSFDSFQQRFEAQSDKSAVISEMAWVQRVGIRGFPALLLQTAGGQLKMIAHGFMPYPALKASVDKALADNADQEAKIANVCDISGGTC